VNINIFPKHKDFESILKLYPPVKASEYLPSWYKKQGTWKREDFKFSDKVPPAKMCPAIKYDLMNGIIIQSWSDIYLNYDKENSDWFCSVGQMPLSDPSLKEFDWLSNHISGQTDYMDLNLGSYGALKLNSPFYIQTEKNIHTKFTDVFHHIRRDVRFISGTVETDIWHEVNFPFEFINAPTDKKRKIIIKAGDPLLMITPIHATNKPSVTINKYDQIFRDNFRVHETKQRSLSLSWNKYKQYRKGIDEEE
tara:strand:- start:936 stop:1688 length:753 start_codon:yes stop_codon:yes gene_type:complete